MPTKGSASSPLSKLETLNPKPIEVIGSRSTLMSDPLWHEWLIWAAARGAICGRSKYIAPGFGVWGPKGPSTQCGVILAPTLNPKPTQHGFCYLISLRTWALWIRWRCYARFVPEAFGLPTLHLLCWLLAIRVEGSG